MSPRKNIHWPFLGRNVLRWILPFPIKTPVMCSLSCDIELFELSFFSPCIYFQRRRKEKNERLCVRKEGKKSFLRVPSLPESRQYIYFSFFVRTTGTLEISAKYFQATIECQLISVYTVRMRQVWALKPIWLPISFSNDYVHCLDFHYGSKTTIWSRRRASNKGKQTITYCCSCLASLSKQYSPNIVEQFGH